MIWVTGADGQLGHDLNSLLKDRAIYTDHHNGDITDYELAEKIIADNKIKVIINAGAYTAVDLAEDEADNAFAVNSKGPENLAKLASKYDCKLIHISTDYVFDGSKNRPYLESDSTNPLGVYGKSKLDGEEAIRREAKAAVIIRTSWLYSTHGKNFFNTIKKYGAERGELKVVFDQVGTPTTTHSLATAIVAIVDQLPESGVEVFHYSNEGVASWYDFACEIIKLNNIKCEVYPVTSDQFVTKAVRPAYSLLDKTKIKKFFNIEIPYWKDELELCIQKQY